MVDQTFGFDTACTEAAKAVNSALLATKSCSFIELVIVK